MAENKHIKLGNLGARIQCNTGFLDKKATVFRVEIETNVNFTEREKKILFNSAKSCEISKILKSDIEIDYRLISGRNSDTTTTEPYAT